MVDGNGDDERKTKYFILSIFICVFAGSFQETVFKIWFVSNIFVKNSKIRRIWWKSRSVEFLNSSNRLIPRNIWFIELFGSSNCSISRIGWFTDFFGAPNFKNRKKSMVITSLVWMASQNLLKSDFILTMERNKFYWMGLHWNVLILKVRDLRTDQYRILFIDKKLDRTGCPNWYKDPRLRLRCL